MNTFEALIFGEINLWLCSERRDVNLRKILMAIGNFDDRKTQHGR